MWEVYFMRCADGSLYCGISTDAKRREREHNRGTGAKYTCSRLPVTLVYREPTADKTAALRRELELKALPKGKKEALVSAYALRSEEPGRLPEERTRKGS